MESRVLLYGVISSYMIFICSGLDSNALEKKEASKESNADGNEMAGVMIASKEKKVAELVTKICNIAKGTLKTATKDEKSQLLNDIEQRLRGSTNVEEGDRDMYVEIIMKGVRLMVENADTGLCRKIDSQYQIIEHLGSKDHQSLITNNGTNKESASSKIRKKEMAKQFETKLDNLVNKALQNVNTERDKKRMLAKIKAKVTKAFENNETLKDFVMASLTLALRKANSNNSSNLAGRRAFDEVAKKREAARETTESIVLLTTPIACDIIKKDACGRLKYLNEYKCLYDDLVLPLKLVCDGSMDCADGSDEMDCERQAAERITNSSDFIKYLNVHKECFEEIHSNSVLSRQGALLSGVLKTQLDFIQKYTINNPNPLFKPSRRFQLSAEDISKELLLITKTFNLALTGALCMEVLDEADEQVKMTGRKLDWELKKIEKQIKFSPKACPCEGKLCTSKNCSNICKRVCYQKYTLGRFACKAVSKDGSVPLSEVCDGKFDCTDKSDEIGCVSDSRHQAGIKYSDLVEVVESKITSREFKPIWNHLKSINNLIRQIQKLSVSPDVDLYSFRVLRNGCFDLLVAAFIDLLDSARNVDEGEDAYEFFLSVNEKLINALKHSYTGNGRIISASQCYCRGLECASTNCSRGCIVHCAVKPSLTTYACRNLTARNHTFVDIDNICNGVQDCSNGADEKNCAATEVCRSHHLKVLRKNIQNLDDKNDNGAILDDVFNAWKVKVTSSILIAEKSARITIKTIKDLIRKMLDDLVTAYATMYDERRVAKPASLVKAFKKIEKLSQKIIDTVKLCGK